MDATIAWMIAGGARLDDQEPNPDHLEHLAALREANRLTASSTAPFARVAAALGFQLTHVAVDPLTRCCAAA